MKWKKLLSVADKGSIVLGTPDPDHGIVTVRFTYRGAEMRGQYSVDNSGVYAIGIENEDDFFDKMEGKADALEDDMEGIV